MPPLWDWDGAGIQMTRTCLRFGNWTDSCCELLKVERLSYVILYDELCFAIQRNEEFLHLMGSDLSLTSALQDAYSPSHDVKWQKKSSSSQEKKLKTITGYRQDSEEARS